jgi:hypothetical protein
MISLGISEYMTASYTLSRTTRRFRRTHSCVAPVFSATLWLGFFSIETTIPILFNFNSSKPKRASRSIAEVATPCFVLPILTQYPTLANRFSLSKWFSPHTPSSRPSLWLRMTRVYSLPFAHASSREADYVLLSSKEYPS